ncbi:diguanylate cyclase [Aromatoleum diolicum]|uniref:diguanylate cyclase n=1 Tax=Aromatoleum diolicum TaxID=75796 RepID=UPI00145E8BCB|nr:diguanylate cyclase [Aromatoleum diolicum]
MLPAALALLATPGVAIANRVGEIQTSVQLEPIQLATTFHVGALAAMLVYNLLLYFTVRERSHLEFVLFTFGLALGQIALSGLGTQLLWAENSIWVHAAQPAGFTLAGLCAALFARSFLDTRARAPGLDAMLKLAASLFGAALIAAFIVPGRFSNPHLALIAPLFALLAMVCGLRCRQLRAPGATLYFAGWTTLLVGATLFSAARIGWFAHGGLALHAMEAASALGILILSFALSERTGARLRERVANLAEELANSEHTIEALQASEQFLTQGMARRNLELEALTQRLQECEQRFQQLSHHDPLTGAANQLLLGDRIEQGIIRSKRHNCRTAVIMLALDDFKPINDTYGDDVGDEILRAVVVRLRKIVREQDTVARPDNDCFAIVLEEVYDANDLQRVANAVAAEFAQPFHIREHTIMLDASLGSAISTERGTNATALLKQAGKLMRRNKEIKRLNRSQGGGSGFVAA